MSLDKRWLRRSFSAAAADYDRLAVLQRRIGERLLTGLPRLLPAGALVDVGAGTGWCAARLRYRYPGAAVLLVDIAEAMLHQARKRLKDEAVYLVADAERLPLADGSAALIVSNLALQWCPDPRRAVEAMARALRPGGRLLLSTFAAGTLAELRQAWARVDRYSHVNEFLAVPALEGLLREAGFRTWQVDAETLRCRYPSLAALFRELKGIGAHNVTRDRPRHLLGKGRLRRLEAAYPRENGAVVASFVPAYVIAVK